RAHARDRRAACDRRAAERHPLAVPSRGGAAHLPQRIRRRPPRIPRLVAVRADVRLADDRAAADRPAVDPFLLRAGDLLRIVSGAAGGAAQSDRSAAIRVMRGYVRGSILPKIAGTPTPHGMRVLVDRTGTG